MKAYRYTIPLRRPLTLKGTEYEERQGILLERDGNWAEASPLPGFSKETIDDVLKALRDDTVPVPASLDFAFSVLDREFQRVCVPMNRLLLGDTKQLIQEVAAFAASGCRAVKLKVGRSSVEEDIDLVKQVRQRLPADVQLRLDANRAWDLEEAVRFVEGLAGIDWEYIEEPLQNSHELELLYSQTGARYALDETLAEEVSWSKWPNATTLICKPTILGGRNIIDRLAATEKPIVFSASFESGIGIARIMQLASEYSDSIPAGLGTLAWLADDLLLVSPAQQNGNLILDSLSVDKSRLEPIEL